MGILIPIGISTLGYVIYKLVDWGLAELKEYADSGGDLSGNCPPGTVFYGIGQNGEIHCVCKEGYVLNPQGECVMPYSSGQYEQSGGVSGGGQNCPPGTRFVSMGANGQINCECIPPYGWDPNLAKCTPPTQLTTAEILEGLGVQGGSGCPPGTRFVSMGANGQINCECVPPYGWDPNLEQCTPPGGTQTASVAQRYSVEKNKPCKEDEITVVNTDGSTICRKRTPEERAEKERILEEMGYPPKRTQYPGYPTQMNPKIYTIQFNPPRPNAPHGFYSYVEI